jgi:hypothetical protein
MANPCKVVSTSQTSGAHTSDTYQVCGFWREQMILPGFTVCRLVSQTMLESEPVFSDLLQNFREVGSFVGVERKTPFKKVSELFAVALGLVSIPFNALVPKDIIYEIFQI